MKRKIYKNLQDWKKSPYRLPLVIKGPRQVGKTFIISEFGRNEYDNFVYCNFDDEKNLFEIFENDLDPEEIVAKLEKIKHTKIHPNNTLIIFDEIQTCPRAIASLKYFAEKANYYHIIASGSLLGVSVNRQTNSYPVGKIDELKMYPLDFEEYLNALNRADLINEIKSCFVSNKPMLSKLHNECLKYYERYLFVGGMPDVVNIDINTSNDVLINQKKKLILNNYLDDMSKYNSPEQTCKTRLIFETIPTQLAKENKKFKYSLLQSGARRKEYELPLQWLELSGIASKVHRIEQIKLPLKAYSSHIDFKLYMNDQGLCCGIENISYDELISDSKIDEFRGGLVENYVYSQLINNGLDLYYWTNDNTAEVDFITKINSHIVPIEVKSGVHNQSKSLKQYMLANKTDFAIRISAKNFGFDNNIKSVPLYAVFCIRNDNN